MYIPVLGDGFALSLVVTALFSFVFAGLAWQKRSEHGGLPLVIYNIIIAVTMIAYALDILSTIRSLQVLFLLIWFPLQALVATTWLYTAIEFTGLQRLANRRTIAALSIEPAVVFLLIVFPSTQPLLYELPENGVVGSIYFAGVTSEMSGPLLPLHLGFTLTVTLAGTVLLVRLLVRSKHLYRIEAISVVVAAVAPWIVVLIQANNIAPVEDPSAIAFAVSGMALTAGLYRFKKLDPVPAARAAIVDEIGDGVIVLDSDNMISSINSTAKDFFIPGADDEKFIGTHIERLFPNWSQLEGTPGPDSGPTDWQEISLSINGHKRFLEVQRSPFRDRFDRRIGQLIVFRDITKRTQNEKNLARFRTIFESVTDRVYVLDDNGEFIMVNEPLATLVGVEPAQLKGKSFSSILAADSDSDPTAVPSGTETLECVIEADDGEEIPCEIRRAPISFEGLETGSVGILRDISRRRQIESSLQRTTEQLQTIIEASPLAIVATDADGEVELWNSAANEMFGWSETEVHGHFPPLVISNREAQLRELYVRVLNGERITGHEMELNRKNNSIIEASLSLAPITDRSGTVQGTVGTITDITDRKERERRLQRQNERLDEFAGLVSHDLRNPLQVGTTHLELLSMDADLAEDEQEHVDEAISALERMEALIEDTLTLAREGKDIGETRSLVIDQIARRAWDAVSTPEATLVIEDNSSTSVDGDPSRIQELFENLFRNALEHGIPSEPDTESAQSTQSLQSIQSTQSTQESAQDAAQDDSNAETQPMLTVRVEIHEDGFAVEDDGQGIDEIDEEQLFELGYTTSTDGTGFGMAIVKRIADAHGWTVSVTTGADGGARFEFETA